MLHFLKVLYYQSYLFYKKGWTSITKHDNIPLMTIHAVSCLLTYPIMALIILILVKVFEVSDPYRHGTTIILVVILYEIWWHLLYNHNKWEQIVKKRPVLFGNRKLSAANTIICYIVSILITMGIPIWMASNQIISTYVNEIHFIKLVTLQTHRFPPNTLPTSLLPKQIDRCALEHTGQLYFKKIEAIFITKNTPPYY